MLFSNPAIIKNFNDAKLAMVETDKQEMCFLDLMALVKYRLERLVKEEVDEMMKKGGITREEAIQSIALRAYDLLEFTEQGNPLDEEALVEVLMKQCLNFEVWEAEIWTRFQGIHQNKIEKDTPIPTQGVVGLPEDALTEALDELTLQGILEVLMKYN